MDFLIGNHLSLYLYWFDFEIYVSHKTSEQNEVFNFYTINTRFKNVTTTQRVDGKTVSDNKMKYCEP